MTYKIIFLLFWIMGVPFGFSQTPFENRPFYVGGAFRDKASQICEQKGYSSPILGYNGDILFLPFSPSQARLILNCFPPSPGAPIAYKEEVHGLVVNLERINETTFKFELPLSEFKNPDSLIPKFKVAKLEYCPTSLQNPGDLPFEVFWELFSFSNKSLDQWVSP